MRDGCVSVGVLQGSRASGDNGLGVLPDYDYVRHFLTFFGLTCAMLLMQDQRIQFSLLL